MVKESLVEKYIPAGNSLINELKRVKIDVRTAFWYYSDSQNVWILVIGSPNYDREGPLKTYAKIQGVLYSDPELHNIINLARIRIESAQNHVIRNLKEKLKGLSFPLEATISIPGFSDELIQDVYVYKLQ